MDRQTFDNLDLQEIANWVASQRQEDLHLDFKLFSGGADLSKNDKKNFAKAISGFANSDGGLIVWGVDCRKDPATGIDAAVGLKPVPNAAAILSRFQSLTGDATSPIVEGVEHRVILDQGAAGFIATFVPSSDSAPHMAMLGENCYYKRSGDSFYQMEHFDIADMFGRRLKPRLHLGLTHEHTTPTKSADDYSAIIRLTVSIENTGRGIARFPFAKLRVSTPHKISDFELDGNGRSGLPRRIHPPKAPEWSLYAGGANDVIHSGTSLQLTAVEARVPEILVSVEDIVVEYVLSADGVQPITGQERFSGSKLREVALEAIHSFKLRQQNKAR